MANDIIAAKQAAETAYAAWITAVNAQDEEPTPAQRQLVRVTVLAYHKALGAYNRLRGE